MNDVITLGSVLGSVVTTAAVLFGVYMNGRKLRREAEADIRDRDTRLEKDARDRTDELKGEIAKHNDSVEVRLTKLEAKSADFMPRAEIEAKVEHEKTNRIAASEATRHVLERHSADIVEIKVTAGRMEQKQDGTAAEMGEIKALLKEQSREFNAKLDKLTEAINSLSRRAA